MASKATKGWEKRLALHWFTYSAHVLKKGLHYPVETPNDWLALREIMLVQSSGDEDRASAMLEEIVRAPLICRSLHARYVEFWAWTEAGQPKRYSEPSSAGWVDIENCIAVNAEHAA